MLVKVIPTQRLMSIEYIQIDKGQRTTFQSIISSLSFALARIYLNKLLIALYLHAFLAHVCLKVFDTAEDETTAFKKCTHTPHIVFLIRSTFTAMW